MKTTFLSLSPLLLLLALGGCGGGAQELQPPPPPGPATGEAPLPGFPTNLVTGPGAGPAIYNGPEEDAAAIGYVSPGVPVLVKSAPVGDRVRVLIDGPIKARGWLRMARLAAYVTHGGRVRGAPVSVHPCDMVGVLALDDDGHMLHVSVSPWVRSTDAGNEGALVAAGTYGVTAPMTPGDARAIAAANAPEFFQPTSCVTVTSTEPATATYTLADCTGPGGVAHLTGTYSVTFTAHVGGGLEYHATGSVNAGETAVPVDARGVALGPYEGLIPVSAVSGTRPDPSACVSPPGDTARVPASQGVDLYDHPNGRVIAQVPALDPPLAVNVARKSGDWSAVRIGAGPYLVGYVSVPLTPADATALATIDAIAPPRVSEGQPPWRILLGEVERPLLRVHPGARVLFNGEAMGVLAHEAFARELRRYAGDNPEVDIYVAGNDDLALRGMVRGADVDVVADVAPVPAPPATTPPPAANTTPTAGPPIQLVPGTVPPPTPPHNEMTY